MTYTDDIEFNIKIFIKMMSAHRFATAINCIDGRIQEPVIKYIKTVYGVDFVDLITEPGPNKILSENCENKIIESIRRRVEISIIRHNSELIALVGHHDCAGNPVEQGTQEKQIRMAFKVVELWNFNAQIIGLWVDKYREVHKVPL